MPLVIDYNTFHSFHAPVATTSLLLVHAPIAELRPTGIVNGIRDDLLNLLGQTFLEHLGNDGLAGGVRDLASFLV